MKRPIIFPVITILLLFWSPSSAQEGGEREKDYETAITKGEYAVGNGDYASAIGYFQKAREAKPGDKNASLWLGVAYSRAGDAERAAAVFSAILAADPADQEARYELGVALYKKGDQEDARAQFTQVAETAADEVLRDAAKTYLDRIGRKGVGGRLSLGIQGGLQYDSNVIFDPENPNGPPKERKSDGRGVLSLDGRYRFVDSGAFSATAGYQLYQSLHFHLEDFNIQQHALSLGGRAALGDNTAAGLTYAFTYTDAGTRHYTTVHLIQPALDLRFSSTSLTQVRAGYASRRYFNNDDNAFPGNPERNVKNSSAGITHTVQIAKGTGIAVDYTYDRDSDAASAVWRSTGNKGSLRFQSDLGPFILYGNASYTDRRYDAPATALGPARHDRIQNYLAGLARDLSKTTRLNLSDDYTHDNSNQTLYRYKRNIVGLFVEMRL